MTDVVFHVQGLFGGSGNANDSTISALGASSGGSMPVSAVQRQVMLQQIALSKQSGTCGYCFLGVPFIGKVF